MYRYIELVLFSSYLIVQNELESHCSNWCGDSRSDSHYWARERDKAWGLRGRHIKQRADSHRLQFCIGSLRQHIDFDKSNNDILIDQRVSEGRSLVCVYNHIKSH
jgi:hypothetical protein